MLSDLGIYLVVFTVFPRKEKKKILYIYSVSVNHYCNLHKIINSIAHGVFAGCKQSAFSHQSRSEQMSRGLNPVGSDF